jgi:capsule polysaccharide export protein KpsE/RkpR
VIKSSQQDLITSYTAAINAKESGLSAIGDSLRKFQSVYGIYNAEIQSEFLSTLVSTVETRLVRERAMLNSYKSNRSLKGAADTIVHLTASIAGLEQQWDMLMGDDSTSSGASSFKRFAEGKGRVELYDDAYKKAVNTLNVDRELLKQMQAAVALDVTAVHLIEEATVPAVKFRPRRSLLVITCTFAAFLFLVLGILFFESTRHQDWRFLRW